MSERHPAAGTPIEVVEGVYAKLQEWLHTLPPEQIEWFRAGSALSVIRRHLAA